MEQVPHALIRRRPEPVSPGFGLELRNAAPTSASSARADLPQLFHQLSRLRASLCADLDARLCSQHGIPITAFLAMSELSHRREGCDEASLSAALSIAPDELHVVVETLVASGHVRRSEAGRDSAGSTVTPTLRGRALLIRASRTVDRELERRIGSVLSQREIAQVEHALDVLRSTLA